jgi:putative transposase
MKPDRERHYRRSIRLRDFDYSQPGFYFLSICSHNRALMFGEVIDGRMSTNKFGQILETYWDQLPERFQGTESVAFVVMPNHVHGIIHIVVAITSSCGHVLPLHGFLK